MWHASAAPLAGWPPDQRFLRSCAYEALAGVGDIHAGEWEDWTGRAYHVRRRLTDVEQAQVGDVCDIRGTHEAEARRALVLRFLPADMRNWKE